jgi:hypothetical protein
MAQFARPASDNALGGWVNKAGGSTNLFAEIDEVSADGDGSYIEADSTDTIYETGLTTVTDPENNLNHAVHIVIESLGGGGGGEKLDIFLYEGATEIANWSNVTANRGSYVDEGPLDLSTVEAGNISDYSNLRLWVEVGSLGGGETIRVTQAYFTCDDAPAAPPARIPFSTKRRRMRPLLTM